MEQDEIIASLEALQAVYDRIELDLTTANFKRAGLIYEAYQAGLSFRKIGGLIDLSQTAVKNIYDFERNKRAWEKETDA